MIKVYADLVVAGKRSLDGANGITKVPEKYLDDVIQELIKRGFIKEEVKEEPVEEEIDKDFLIEVEV